MSRGTGRRGGVIGTTVVVLGAVVAAVVIGGGLLGNLFGDLFGSRTIDRSPPPVLQTLRDLSEYKAASASFEVLVDTERDVKFLPSFLAGERTLFIGLGSVDATVDFSKLGEGAVVVSPDHSSASIRLPRAVLQHPVVDTEQSHVASRSRGLFDRIAGVFTDEPVKDKPLYQAAEVKMAAAAEATSLRDRAEANTRTMLTTLLRGLGINQVTVSFIDPVPTAPAS